MMNKGKWIKENHRELWAGGSVLYTCAVSAIIRDASLSADFYSTVCCLHASLSPFLHVSMSPCPVSMFHMFPCHMSPCFCKQKRELCKTATSVCFLQMVNGSSKLITDRPRKHSAGLCDEEDTLESGSKSVRSLETPQCVHGAVNIADEESHTEGKEWRVGKCSGLGRRRGVQRVAQGYGQAPEDKVP
jgi:hypothetical protein